MQTRKRLYLIQGTFFQGGRHHQFTGMIYPSSDNDGVYEGLIHDDFGYSKVMGVIITEGCISFNKRYCDCDRGRRARYTISQISGKNIWVGRHGKDRVESGRVNALVTEISPDFLNTRIVCAADVMSV